MFKVVLTFSSKRENKATYGQYKCPEIKSCDAKPLSHCCVQFMLNQIAYYFDRLLFLNSA